MAYIIGIDGGATKSIGVLTDLDGYILSERKSGPTNYRTQGLDKAGETLSDLVKDLIAQEGINLSAVKYLVCGLAGLDRPSDEKRVKRALSQRLEFSSSTEIILTNDLYIALLGAIKGRFGVVINSGTGAIAMGINKEGEVARADGWGYILGDEGSGYWIGIQAIKAGLKNYDGRGEKTQLSEAIKSHFGLANVEGVLDVIYDSDRPLPPKVADLAPGVFRAAKEEDSQASNILRRAGTKLGQTTYAVIKRLGLESKHFPVATLGGILQLDQSNPVKEKLIELVKEVAPHCSFIEPAYPPEIGAIMMGLRKEHGEIAQTHLDHLNEFYE